MSNVKEEIQIGTKVKVGGLQAPKGLEFLPGKVQANRRTGATGAVVGFYRLSQNTFYALAHNDGTDAAYTSDEIEVL